jgi:hypothetical protein
MHQKWTEEDLIEKMQENWQLTVGLFLGGVSYLGISLSIWMGATLGVAPKLLLFGGLNLLTAIIFIACKDN